jgi:hypothetical protein
MKSLSAKLLQYPRLGSLVLLVAVPLFWKLRIIDLAANPLPTLRSGDLYIEHYPTLRYGFEALRAGRIPLWNPGELCGVPFLAVPFSGLWYPGNWLYLIADTAVAIELSFLLHAFLGSFGMMRLLRDAEVPRLASLCAALSFIWSGWAIFNVNQPTIFAALMWAPATVAIARRVIAGKAGAWLLLALAVALQFLLGAAEVFVHNLQLVGLFVVGSGVQLAWRQGIGPLLRRAGLLVSAAGLTVLLVAVQLVPSAELVSNSVRAPGKLSLDDAVGASANTPGRFLRAALTPSVANRVAVGFLPLIGVAVVLGFGAYRTLWVCGLFAVVGAAVLALGGKAFALYHGTPIGGMFRHSMKFLGPYAFAQALLVGLAIARLQTWVALPRAMIWRRPPWLLALLVGVGCVLWLGQTGRVDYYLLATVALFLLLGIAPAGRSRCVVLSLLCAVHLVSVFLSVGNPDKRPFHQPEVFDQRVELVSWLRDHAGADRVWTSHRLQLVPALTVKQLGLQGINNVVGYAPLAPARYESFFLRAGKGIRPKPFYGQYLLDADANWKLMDLTSTRYYVVTKGDPLDRFMEGGGSRRGAPEFQLAYDGPTRVYERSGALPRAYLVPGGRFMGDAEMLRTLDDPGFDPRSEVLLEGSAAANKPRPQTPRNVGMVRSAAYSPERIVLSLDVRAPGYLVLTDAFYPGWRAVAGGREVPVHRANYLFRAVAVAPGTSEVVFEYRPGSFRLGALISATALLAALGLATYGTVKRNGVRRQVTLSFEPSRRGW